MRLIRLSPLGVVHGGLYRCRKVRLGSTRRDLASEWSHASYNRPTSGHARAYRRERLEAFPPSASTNRSWPRLGTRLLRQGTHGKASTHEPRGSSKYEGRLARASSPADSLRRRHDMPPMIAPAHKSAVRSYRACATRTVRHSLVVALRRAGPPRSVSPAKKRVVRSYRASTGPTSGDGLVGACRSFMCGPPAGDGVVVRYCTGMAGAGGDSLVGTCGSVSLSGAVLSPARYGAVGRDGTCMIGTRRDGPVRSCRRFGWTLVAEDRVTACIIDARLSPANDRAVGRDGTCMAAAGRD